MKNPSTPHPWLTLINNASLANLLVVPVIAVYDTGQGSKLQVLSCFKDNT